MVLPENTKTNPLDPSKPLGDILKILVSYFRTYSDTPHQDAQLLCAQIINKPRAWILSHPEYQPQPDELEAIIDAIRQTKQKVPLPYILGEWEFYGLAFNISPAVLIPRPETEYLVDKSLEWLNSHPKAFVADVGTGSGCIAVSISKHAVDAQIVATDISEKALQIASNNAERHCVTNRIWFVNAHLLPPVTLPFNLIVANLPYIPSSRLRQLAVSQHEPILALDGGSDGLKYITQLINQANHTLAQPGAMLLELDSSHAKLAMEIALDIFPEAEITLDKDLAGKFRYLSIIIN